MKRRNLILSFVIVALLLVGIGYAALSETLTITNNVSFTENQNDLNVVFVDTDAATSGEKEITVTFTLSSADDSQDQTVIVKNLGKLGANVKVKEVTLKTGADGYVTVTPDSAAQSGFDLAVNASQTITITAALVKVPAGTASFTYTITLDVTALDTAA